MQIISILSPIKPWIIRFERTGLFMRWMQPMISIFRVHGAWHGGCMIVFLIEAHLRTWWNRRRLECLTTDDINARRKSDTVFVFGSGASLNEISDAEWERIREHDTIGLNYFVHQRWVDVSVHCVRELEQPYANRFHRRGVLDAAVRFMSLARDSPHYSRTIYFLQQDFFAEAGKSIIGWKMLPEGHPVCLYRGLRRHGAEQRPPNSLAEGLPRQAGAIGAGIAIARLCGWKRIVVAGVDLYDSRYFWLPPDATRNRFLDNAAKPHPTLGRGIVDIAHRWRDTLNGKGIECKVYNPRSLLRRELAQFEWPDGQRVHAEQSLSQSVAER